TRVIKLDFRPGGVFHYCMRTPDGHEMWGKFVYREILAPERIVFINSFADKEGNTIQAPFSPTWPLEVLNTLTFSEHAGKTTLTIRSIPYKATKEERETFETGLDSMRQGFNGSLERLSDYLASGQELSISQGELATARTMGAHCFRSGSWRRFGRR